jgi:DNA invertase Pin-like site-specific DNA recombinase
MFYDDLKEKEKYWIRKLNTYRKSYNSTIGGDGLIGVNVPKGEKNPYSVVTEKQAQEIIDLLRAGEIMLEEIAERYNVSMSTIGAINTGRNWSHLYKGDCPSKAGRKRIKNQRGEKIGHAKVSSEQVIEIKRLLADGLSRKKVAEQLNIALSTVDNIKGGYS